MAKQTGLGMKVEVDDSGGVVRDISNDIRNIQFSTPRGVIDVTGLDKSGMERLLAIADGKVTMAGVFNATANKSHDVFKTIPSTSVVRTVKLSIPPLTTGSPLLSMEMVLEDYSLTRGDNGEMNWTVPASLADGTVPTWTTQP